MGELEALIDQFAAVLAAHCWHIDEAAGSNPICLVEYVLGAPADDTREVARFRDAATAQRFLAPFQSQYLRALQSKDQPNEQ